MLWAKYLDKSVIVVGVNSLVRIKINEFAQKYVISNPGENLEDVKSRLKAALKEKQNGGKCQVCGSPIWAIGSALGGLQGCFTCITGESDESEDYEIE